jgi:rhodanese-related sulfurtransferase
MTTGLRVLILAAGGSAVGVTANAVSPNGVAWKAVLPTAATDEASCVAPVGTKTISLQEALRLHQAAQATFVDVRAAERYERGHIEGALHMPCRSSTRLELKVPATRPVVVYGEGSDAGRAADALYARGFVDVSLLEGGFSTWRQAHGPAEAGSCEGCTDNP